MSLLLKNREDSGDSLLNNGPRSEYVKKYPEHPIERTKSYRPANEPVSVDEPLDDQTVQKRDFPEHPIAVRAAYKPSTQRQNLDPFLAQTSHRDEYPEWQLPEKRVREREHWNPPVEPLETSTSQRRDYPGHPTPRRVVYKPDDLKQELPPFQGQPSYRDNYPEWELPEKKVRKSVEWLPPSVPMANTSTNKDEFPEHQVSPRAAYRPDNKPVASDVPFGTSTDYQDTFKAHPVQPRKQRPKQEWNKPLDKLDGTTTMQKDFQGVYAPRQASMRPTAAPVASDVPLASDTTTATSYQAHAVTRPHKYTNRQNAYEPPEGHMESTTTNMATFQEHEINKPKYIKPGSSHLLQGRGTMASDTTMSHYYTNPPPAKRELLKRREEYQPPSEPIASHTTAGDAFTAHNPVPRRSYRPDGGYKASSEPFQDATEIKEAYTEHALPPRHVTQRETHKPPSAAFDPRTTAGDSFLGPSQPKREMFRPDRSLVKSDLPMESDTTTGTSYKPWEATPRHRHKQAEWEKPEGVMDLSTTNREAYLGARGERPSMRRLGDSSLLHAAGKFEDLTSYGNDFVPKDMSNRKMVKPDNQYEPPSLPFEASTTYRNSHIGYTQPKQQSRRPGALSDVLLQRDKGNKFHIRGPDWRQAYDAVSA